MRTIRPKDEQDESSSAFDSVPTAPKSAKRRCISSACIPCRKRKSKCDGAMPNCSTCIAVYQTTCSYDVDSDHRRKAALKRDIEQLRGQNNALGVIVASLRSSTDAEAAEIVQQIRADEDLDSLAETLKKNVMLPERSGAMTAEGELPNLIGRPALDAAGVVRPYGHTSSLSLVSPSIQSPVHLQHSEPWTSVTPDAQFVEHLMNLYFTWSHPFYSLFSKELFWNDMTRGRSKYCSPLLVNALLSVACAYSDRPEARSNPSDPSTSGDHFFAEAKRLLYENGSSSLTTVQALAVMGLREASCGRDSSGFQYAGRCTRMAIELGLHVSFCSTDHRFSGTEIEARKITFWGCFINETAWAICLGRISQLPRAASNLEPPSIIETQDSNLWKPYTDYGWESIPGAGQPILTQLFARHFSLLSEIVDDTGFMSYAPRERFTSRKLLDFHCRYTDWSNNLPENLRLRDVATPHVLVLHMYYHTCVLHLFRPFLKVDLNNSLVSPRETCTSCANRIASLLSTYRQTYGLRRIPLLATHIILTSAIIHLLNSPDSSPGLITSITCLREMTTVHSFSKRCLEVIMALAKQWSIKLPNEVSQAACALSLEAKMKVMDKGTPSSQKTDSYLSPLSDRAQQLDHIYDGATAGEMPFAAIKNSPRSSTTPADLFWSPFADQSLPLQANHRAGPMDISAMLDVPNNDCDQLQRDGFRIASLNDPNVESSAYSHINSQLAQTENSLHMCARKE